MSDLKKLYETYSMLADKCLAIAEAREKTNASSAAIYCARGLAWRSAADMLLTEMQAAQTFEPMNRISFN